MSSNKKSASSRLQFNSNEVKPQHANSIKPQLALAAPASIETKPTNIYSSSLISWNDVIPAGARFNFPGRMEGRHGNGTDIV